MAGCRPASRAATSSLSLPGGVSGLVSDHDYAVLGHASTAALFNHAAVAAANKTVIVEWIVDDVDAEYARLEPIVREWEQEPTTMPWGNRSVLFRDPDGNLVNLFTPVSPDARERFGTSPKA